MTNDTMTVDPQMSVIITCIIIGIFIGIWLHKHFVSNKYLEELEYYHESSHSGHKNKPYMKMYFDDED